MLRRSARALILFAAASFATPLPAQVIEVKSTSGLRNQIVALSPRVRPDDAQRVAAAAYAVANQLRRDYRLVGPALFHNFLVNIGIRKRGLCFQWAEDLLARLDRLQPSSLEFHWGEARAGTLREHNCVVVTARGQPFRNGVVLDCWRHSGRLYWSALTADHYPWVEDSAYAQLTRARRSSPTNDASKPALVNENSALPRTSGDG